MIGIFDLDGTLVDSDQALADAFVALGVARSDVTFGHVLSAECERLGLTVDDYVAVYDADQATAFAHVDQLLGSLPTWAVCSNKHAAAGRAELARFGWRPEVACFSDRFDGGPKRLEPVLAELGVVAGEVLFVGDTAHDRACAQAVGCQFVLAGWNPRARPETGDLVANHPNEILALLGR